MTLGGDLPNKKPAYKLIDPKKSTFNAMDRGENTDNSRGESSDGVSTFKKESQITSIEEDVSVSISVMVPYELAEGVHKLGWDYLLNILGNSISSAQVSEKVDILFKTQNSNGDKYLMGMRFDLRTLPASHELHPDNKSPIFNLITETNARTISTQIISIEGAVEQLVTEL